MARPADKLDECTSIGVTVVFKTVCRGSAVFILFAICAGIMDARLLTRELLAQGNTRGKDSFELLQ